MNLVKVAAFLHVLPLAAFATDCNFGSGCPFTCQCADPDEVCDPLTGHCDRTGCKANLPDYTPSQPGWRGDACQTGNVAYNKRAWQYHGYGDRVASRAVDGVVDRSRNGVSQPAFAGGGRAWWTVDLGALHTVYSVRMMNADLNGGWFFLNHIRVYVSNSSIPDNNARLGTEADIMLNGAFVVCGEYNDKVPQGGDGEVVCGQPLVGRYVLLWKSGKSTVEGDVQSSFITSEVTVTGHRYQDCTSCSTECNPTYGCIANCPAGKNQTTFCSKDCADGTFGVNCGRQCSGHCRVNGAACEKTDGSCPGGCQLWYGNPICGTEIALPQDDIVDTLALADVTSGSAILTWDPLNSVPSGLESQYGYVIGQQTSQTQSVGTGGEWRNIAWIPYTNTDRVSYTVTGLAHNSQFSVRLQVYRQDQGQNETADGSKTVSVKTACTSPIVPAVRVQSLNLNYNDDVIAAAYVTWNLIKPVDSGCDFITSYLFTSYDEEDNLDNTTSSHIVENNVTVTYVISITAKNNGNLEAGTRLNITLGSRSSQAEPPSTNDLLIPATVTLVAMVVVTVVAVVFILYWRRKKTQKPDNAAVPSPMPPPVTGSADNENINILTSAGTETTNEDGAIPMSVASGGDYINAAYITNSRTNVVTPNATTLASDGVHAVPGPAAFASHMGPPEIPADHPYEAVVSFAVSPSEYTSLGHHGAVYQNIPRSRPN